MKLREKQSIFARKIAVLKLVAVEMGYETTEGDYYRDPRVPYGHEMSLHKFRLAADLNIFKNGKWLTDGTGHDELHDIWDKMGGALRIDKDLNHYSLAHYGMR